jgi:myo-inositol-1(or 4)-monophosphatase
MSLKTNMKHTLYSVKSLVSNNLQRIVELRTDIFYKMDGSPVTAADFFVQNMICEFLSGVLSKPQFISEESFDFNFKSPDGYVVILYPIDGTENFCSGLKEWGISLGIWKDGVHCASMLYMPEMEELIISGDSFNKLNSRITGFSSSLHDEILKGIKFSNQFRVTGCATYNIMNVIRGSFTRFVNPKGVYVWDFLPGLMLALENNCLVEVNGEVFDGRFLDPTKRYCIDISNQ